MFEESSFFTKLIDIMNIIKETKACSKVLLIYDCFRFKERMQMLIYYSIIHSLHKKETNSNLENKVHSRQKMKSLKKK